MSKRLDHRAGGDLKVLKDEGHDKEADGEDSAGETTGLEGVSVRSCSVLWVLGLLRLRRCRSKAVSSDAATSVSLMGVLPF